MTTFQNLIDDVIGHQFSPSRYTDFVKNRLNESQVYITAQTDFRVMKEVEDITIVPGTSEYALPTDFQRHDSALYSTTLAVPFVKLNSLEDPDAIDELDGSSGTPTDFQIEGATLRVWPSPDAAATLRLKYYRLPAQLSGANDVPDIPQEYTYLMVERTLQFCFARENDYGSAQYHQGQFEAGILKCRGEVHHDTNDRSQPRVVKGS